MLLSKKMAALKYKTYKYSVKKIYIYIKLKKVGVLLIFAVYEVVFLFDKRPSLEILDLIHVFLFDEEPSFETLKLVFRISAVHQPFYISIWKTRKYRTKIDISTNKEYVPMHENICFVKIDL